MKSGYVAQLASRWGSGLALVGALAACGQAVPQLLALEPDSDTSCALDGMILMDYPGPKAQAHYAEGPPDFFCDLVELFATLAAPEQMRKINALFVQDMGAADWERPSGSWIDAKTAVYVTGSNKLGSMGPTFGSFSSLADAEAFVKKEGGEIKRFEQLLNAPSHLQPDVSSTYKTH